MPSQIRRKRVWARDQLAFDEIPQAGLALELGTGFTAAMGTLHLPVGSTIGAVLLDFVVTRQVAGTGTTSHLMMGVICVDEPTAAEVSRPLSEPHADWMWWQQIGFGASATGTVSSTFGALGGPLRIKAQRKCEELGSHLWIVFQGIDIAPTFDASVTSSVFMLLP